MDKSPEAFRTISEVAEALETPAHVLRFWESRFPQIKPVKRAGGRRYYRPADVALLTGIKRLLHDEGMTIRGVQKILREQGTRHVSGQADELSPEETALDDAMIARFDAEPDLPPEAAEARTAAALEAALAPAANPPLAGPRLADASLAGSPATGTQSTLDWLANLPDPRSPTHPKATPQAVEDTAAAPLSDNFDRHTKAAGKLADPPPSPPLDAPATVPLRPALSVRSVTGAQVLSASAASPEPEPDSAAASPTLAARLRALPRGSLASRRVALHEIARRITDLRDRLANPPVPR